jgi:predicted Zn-dependent peptidase
MKKQLASNVVATLLPTQQFKTVQIMIDFAAPLRQQTVAQRALVSYLQAVSAQALPTQQHVSQALIDLYGAQYQTDVIRIGKTHHVRFSLQIPAPQYVGADHHLLSDALDFLRQMIFAPLITEDGLFDAAIFAQEKQSLEHDVTGLADDKRKYAVQQLKAYTFSDQTLSWSANGTVSAIQQLTREEVTRAYHDMLTSDAVQVLVSGDIDAQNIADQLTQWSWTNRTIQPLQPFYRQGLRPTTVEMTEQHADLQQALLTFAYHFDMAPDAPERFGALVLNAIFGGSPLSLLFNHVREAASLAYAVSSRYDHDTGMIRVVAGLDEHDITAADALIQEQLTQLQNGRIEPTTLAHIKKSLINDYLSQQDSQGAQLDLAFMRELTGRSLTTQEWVAAVEAVDVALIQQLAQRVHLQTRFVLIPGTAKD